MNSKYLKTQINKRQKIKSFIKYSKKLLIKLILNNKIMKTQVVN
jgi:hypothetical protein